METDSQVPVQASPRRHPPKRLIYLVSAVVVTALGLASRRHAEHLPPFLSDYAGDTLWALMVFLGISFILPDAHAVRRAGIAIGFAYAIEVSQLYDAPWIDALRHTTLGGLVLGFGFMWTDLVCYATGIAIGMAFDTLAFRKRATDGRDTC